LDWPCACRGTCTATSELELFNLAQPPALVEAGHYIVPAWAILCIFVAQLIDRGPPLPDFMKVYPATKHQSSKLPMILMTHEETSVTSPVYSQPKLTI
jgi:hypothetical protein